MVGGILLAAGTSTRFGSEKQSAFFQGQSLLRRAALVLLDSGLSPCIVVLKAGAFEQAALLSDLQVTIVWNERAAEGMSTSIRAGLGRVIEMCNESAEACVITLCDQPLVTAEHLRNLAQCWREGSKPIVATGYSGTRGVPALFARSMFDELVRITGDRGAGPLLQHQPERVAVVGFPQASVDIDLPEDLHSAER